MIIYPNKQVHIQFRIMQATGFTMIPSIGIIVNLKFLYYRKKVCKIAQDFVNRHDEIYLFIARYLLTIVIKLLNS